MNKMPKPHKTKTVRIMINNKVLAKKEADFLIEMILTQKFEADSLNRGNKIKPIMIQTFQTVDSLFAKVSPVLNT